MKMVLICLLRSICFEQSALQHLLWASCFKTSAVSKMLWENCSEKSAQDNLLWEGNSFTSASANMLRQIYLAIFAWKTTQTKHAHRFELMNRLRRRWLKTATQRFSIHFLKGFEKVALHHVLRGICFDKFAVPNLAAKVKYATYFGRIC